MGPAGDSADRERTAVMMSSALQDVKKLLNVPADNTDFDVDIKSLMNSSLAVVFQVCPAIKKSSPVVSGTEAWSDLYDIDEPKTTTPQNIIASFIETFVTMDARLKFDPSINTAVKEAHQACRDEMIWRLSVV